MIVFDATVLIDLFHPRTHPDRKAKLEHLIDNVLTRRMDRTQTRPRPNTLLFVEDDVEILEMARKLFERKVRAIQDFDNKKNTKIGSSVVETYCCRVYRKLIYIFIYLVNKNVCDSHS